MCFLDILFYKRKLSICSVRLKKCVPKNPHKEAKHKTIIAKLSESPEFVIMYLKGKIIWF